MTTTEPQARPTDDQLRAHSSWCDTTKCEGTTRLEHHHQSARIGSVIPAGAPLQQVTVTVDRHVLLDDGAVQHSTSVDLELTFRRADQEAVYCSISPDRADDLATALQRAAALARTQQ